MARRIEKVCATCKHLKYAYKQMGGDVWNECVKEEKPWKGHIFIRATDCWNESCEYWEGKE